MVKWIRLDWNWPLIFLAYFILQIILRTAIGRGLGLDEAELMLTAQTLEWGYGSQPPLYSWIQHGVFALLGETIFSLSLVKNSFLYLTYFALYRLLHIHYDKETAGLATLSLILLPQIAWESQRALSHSVLATTMTVITFLIFTRLIDNRNSWFYFLFGISAALGILSKFNYAILPIAMLVAALSLRSARDSVLNPRILFSFGAASIILLMPLHWIVTHQAKVLNSVHKFNIKDGISTFTSALQGALSLAEASFLFIAVLIVVLLFLHFRYGEKPTDSHQEMPLFQLMSRTVIAALLLTEVAIFWSGTTNVKDRWLQPILVLAAPAMTLWLLPKLSKLGKHRLVHITLVVALLIFIAQLVHDIRPSRRSAPYPAIVSAIADQYPEVKTVFAKNKWIGGNFRHLKKQWIIAVPENNSEALKGRVVFVWQSDNKEIPSSMLDYLKTQNKQVLFIDPTTTIKVAYPSSSQSLFTMSFAAALIN